MAGYFIENDEVGVYVLIEAPTEDYAARRLNEITEDHSEWCECCGERWSPSYPDGPYDSPQIDKHSVYEYDSTQWWSRQGCAILYFHNGRVEKVNLSDKSTTESATL